jgi:hypothetical protein
MSLNGLAARLPGPLVTRVRWRTVAKVDSTGFEVRRWLQGGGQRDEQDRWDDEWADVQVEVQPPRVP